MQKFQNKYTIKSTRLENYDYSQNGLYFVTICIKDKEELFGEIINGEMILNDAGKIANQFWQEIPAHFPFVSLDEFVVMPNHVHGIIEINKNCFGDTNCRDEALPRLETNEHQCINPQHRNITIQDAIINQNEGNNNCQDEVQILTQDAIKTGNQDEAVPRLYSGEYPKMSEISPKSGSLAVIIGSYKSIVSKTTRKQLNPITFSWQPKFYDHVIRNDESLNKIREYIIENPEMWERDRNNVESIFM